MEFSLDNVILTGSFMLFLSIFAGKTGYRFGVPTLLLFLAVGMVFGQDGFGIEFSSPLTAQFIGVVALNVILFSGGMDTKYVEIRPVVKQGVILATVGVLLTAAITGFFIYWLTSNFFDTITFTLLEAFLLASVMSSTDSASVFAILNSKGLVLKERTKPLLELESGSNDPMAYMLTVLLIQLIRLQGGNAGMIVVDFFLQFIIGAVMGFLLGKLAVKIINRINLDNESLYPVLLTAVVFIVFSLTNELKGNGYLATYISGLVIGNSKFVHKKSTKNFMDGMAWLCQIVMFLSLGLLVNPKELFPIAGVGLALSLFMIFFSRPVAVWACLLPFRKMTIRAKHYVSWVGLRGAVPIIFATYPWTSGLPHAQLIFNIVFFVTLVSLLVQGTSVPTMARWLGLAGESKPKHVSAFGVDFDENVKSSMCEITVKDEHLEHGHKVMDMPIPKKTLIVMVKRGDHYFVPTGSTELESGDTLLVISDNEVSLKETYARLGIK